MADLFDAAITIRILLQLNSATSFFDLYFPIIEEYENEDKEHLWNPSVEVYSDGETCMLDHQGWIGITTMTARGSVLVSAVILC